MDDCLVFTIGETSSLDVGSEVVIPPEPAAFPASEEAGFVREGTPVIMTMLSDEGHESMVFFRSPRAFFEAGLLAARGSAHMATLSTTLISSTQTHTHMKQRVSPLLSHLFLTHKQKKLLSSQTHNKGE